MISHRSTDSSIVRMTDGGEERYNIWNCSSCNGQRHVQINLKGRKTLADGAVVRM
jgi:hypothetical protein